MLREVVDHSSNYPRRNSSNYSVLRVLVGLLRFVCVIFALLGCGFSSFLWRWEGGFRLLDVLREGF